MEVSNILRINTIKQESVMSDIYYIKLGQYDDIFYLRIEIKKIVVKIMIRGK